MAFYRVHVEITNICGLACTFCPPKQLPSKTMPIEAFAQLLSALQGKTKILALHVMGDPLVCSNLEEYLQKAYECGFTVELTTSGFYLSHHTPQTLFHPAVRQLNISLNSFQKNDTSRTLDAYLDPILALCGQKIAHFPKPFINLRIWNLDDAHSEKTYNSELFGRLEAFFNVSIDSVKKEASVRLAPKVLLDFDYYFEWPSLQSNHLSHGRCLGLTSHFGILADGTVVPCCLDGEGVINLGNAFETPLDEILASPRVRSIKEGFAQNKAVETLCQKCSYKDRFRD